MRIALTFTSFFAAVLSLSAAADTRTSADFLIRNGTVYNGSDDTEFRGDVVIKGAHIVYVGSGGGERFHARSVIDASGKIVAPGFIDVDGHPESYIRSTDASQRRNAPWLFQGVTTVFIGVDGYGTPDVATDAAQFERQIGTNLACM